MGPLMSESIDRGYGAKVLRNLRRVSVVIFLGVVPVLSSTERIYYFEGRPSKGVIHRVFTACDLENGVRIGLDFPQGRVSPNGWDVRAGLLAAVFDTPGRADAAAVVSLHTKETLLQIGAVSSICDLALAPDLKKLAVLESSGSTVPDSNHGPETPPRPRYRIRVVDCRTGQELADR
jgi:hypothetical protein